MSKDNKSESRALTLDQHTSNNAIGYILPESEDFEVEVRSSIVFM